MRKCPAKKTRGLLRTSAETGIPVVVPPGASRCCGRIPPGSRRCLFSFVCGDVGHRLRKRVTLLRA